MHDRTRANGPAGALCAGLGEYAELDFAAAPKMEGLRCNPSRMTARDSAQVGAGR